MGSLNRQSNQHSFAMVPRAEIQRSAFDRSHGHKTTIEGGRLYPLLVDEVLPGDTFDVKMSAFVRMATLLKPLMDNVYADVFFFFVPNRLVWENWQKFNGEQKNPGDSTDFVVPTLNPTSMTEQDLGAYFGMPMQRGELYGVSSLWFRAYNLIWNEWFRDENLQDSLDVPLGDGPDSMDTFGDFGKPHFRGKRHDYFTSCLPWPQKGPAVELPIGGLADVTGVTVEDWDNQVRQSVTLDPVGNFSAGVDAFGVSGDVSAIGSGFPPNTPIDLDYRIKELDVIGTADLSTATPVTINALREAFQIQRLLERDARGGTRYVEILKAHFGVTSPDFRLQRPEYLGGGSIPVNVHPVANTTGATGDAAQGQLTAFATASASGIGFKRSFTEHGMLFCLVSVRADLNYQQGLDRMFTRSTRFDYYWPALSHLGEQAVLNKEIYHQSGNNPQNDEVFGYQERYAEYRYKPSRITGALNSDSGAGVALDIWHLAEDFGSLPVLNDEFIIENADFPRVIAVSPEASGNAVFIVDTFFNMRTVRPMPVFGVPGLIDHF